LPLDPGQKAGSVTDRPSVKLIACAAVLDELTLGEPAPNGFVSIDGGLHTSPEKLNDALRVAVDEADAPGQTIVLGYGLCSKAVLGLRARWATLVIPRVDDCIALMLGSNEAFVAQNAAEPGTYYLYNGYARHCETPQTEFERLVERYGPERAERMTGLLLANYTRIAVIETGVPTVAACRAYATTLADRFGLRVENVPGTRALLERLVAGPWGDDFVVAPPGHEITLDDFHPSGNGAGQSANAVPFSASGA
jgi:hypothetical protein